MVETLTGKVRAAEAVQESLKEDLQTSKQQLASAHNAMKVMKHSQAGLEQGLQDLRMENEVLKVWDDEIMRSYKLIHAKYAHICSYMLI